MPQSNPVQATPTTPVMPAATPTVSSGVVYVGFVPRLLALLVDMLIIFVWSFILGFIVAMVVGPDNKSAMEMVNLINNFVVLAYYIYFTYKYGATLGKKVMKIKIVREDGQPMTILTVILREVVGKFVSSVLLCLGYFWVMWDKKKQGWHDKIAKTIVIKA